MEKLPDGVDNVSTVDNDLPHLKSAQESKPKYWHHLYADLHYSELDRLVAHYREFKNYTPVPVVDYIKAAIKWSYEVRKINGTNS